MDNNESSLIYQLGVSEEECSVLSLKANSRLLKDLQGADSQACIVFTSTTSARVTIGTEEYDLSFCDTKPTVRSITHTFQPNLHSRNLLKYHRMLTFKKIGFKW